jgi:hypothetical protein
MPNMQNLHHILLNPVNRQIRKRCEHPFSRACLLAFAPTVGEVDQALTAVINRFGNATCRSRIVSPNVSRDIGQVVCCGLRPTYSHQPSRTASTLAQTVAESTNSPRSAAAMPRCTPARNRIVSSIRRKAASFTNCSATVPLSVATCEICSSCSGVKSPCMAPSLRVSQPLVNDLTTDT